MAAMYSSSTIATSERSRRSRLDSTVVDFSPGLDTESDPLLRSTYPFARDHDCPSHEPYRSIATANSCSSSHVSISQQSQSQPSLLQLRHRINRKTDLLLLPLLSTLYLFNGLDRGNVGNAQTQGFTADIGCEPRDLNLAISAFWVMFVACQPVSAAFGRRWGGRVWIVGIMAFIKGRGSLLATRLLIGAFEAGFYPTALAYLTVFYPPYDLAVRIALFYGQYAVAGAFSGAIAYAIFRIEHPTLKSWQLLFLIEGEGMGYSALQANLMSVPPFVSGALGVYLFALSSDRRQERGYHIMAGLAISAVGLAGIVFTTSSSGKYMALCILLFGSYVPPPLTAAWLSNNTRSPNKRALVLGVNGWGNLAGVIGSWVFRIGSDHGGGHGQEERGHEYREPLLITFGFVGIAIMGYWAYTEVLRWENRRMDEAEVGKMVEESSMKWDSENRFISVMQGPAVWLRCG
ncbi:MFS general substrate transporter, partial [Neurospora tetrasperma FGSC 2509]